MRNIKLILEYDGTNYSGWQRQENAQSVQGMVESALQGMLQEQVAVIGAGRTDAGVHARGQVANFRTERPHSLKEVFGGLNALLPDDIVVCDVSEAPTDFHSRYSAKARMYSYTITYTPSALMRSYSWYVKYDLNVDSMNRVAESIKGVHDFMSFCKVNAEVDHYRCEVSEAHWIDTHPKLMFVITANRFLHGMVRALVGTMINVGRGYTTVEEFDMILQKKDRSAAGMAAPPQGLILEKVTY